MNTQTLGPAGGKGGKSFTDYAIPAGARISEIRIKAGEFIDSLQIVYIDANGKTVVMDQIGGDGGDAATFKLGADEFITGISGQHGWYIDSLTFHTNKRVSKSYGGHYGHEAFAFQAPDGECVNGFIGRAERYIDAIGITTAPCQSGKKASAAKPAASGKSSLQKIAGLGPKAAAVLIDEGIHNAETLAKTSVDKLEAIFKKAGGRLANAKVASWPEQAMHVVKKDWEALKKLQAALKNKK